MTRRSHIARFLTDRTLDPLFNPNADGTIYALARQNDGSHFAAVTDPGSSLEELAGANGFRQVVYGDPDIGAPPGAL